MSNNLISREALINAKPEFMNEKVVRGTKYRTTKDRIYAKAWNACNSYWLSIINNAPTVEQPTGEWIPVSERLPEDDSDVIITYVGEIRTLFIEMGWFSEDRFLSQDGKLEITEVVAWMPLPEPYKKEGRR